MKHWLYAWGVAACWALPQGAPAQVATSASGVVIFEAESATTNTPRGAHAWLFTNDLPVFSSTGFLRALPDLGSNIQVNVTGSSPELVYPLAFNESGTYRVWLRGYATGPNDDSVHFGLNGATSAAWNLNLNSNAWRWTNLNVSGGTAVMTVPSSGTHTFHLWMREDGLRVDRIALVTDANFRARSGNGFHTPSVDSEGDLGKTMRNPLRGVGTNTAVEIISGNQYQGAGGDPGNQLQTGSAILYKHATATVWHAQQLYFYKNGTTLPNGINNKYYSNAIPAGLFQPGDTVQYYLRMPYSDHLPAYVYGNANLSIASEFEKDAQADPFTYTVEGPLQPAGGFLAITNDDGSVVVEVYTNSGHLVLRGPDLGGAPFANAITFAPGQAEVAGETYPLADVTAWTALTNGVELVQRLAGTTV